ncbi:hypothetical protein LHYA1_G007399 [Lachnellula hyalina]|uniref:Uncharacterized protein n=1 Tax=Lachnellula hyalina TaxID=1316788 RepID=A0A8H8QW63_9HELO|nr:uncharacterized protein LHYA1_G007399 [Lachnellula hyalina]TVY23942.1 hypothetical protein LHYA1_G007399 [Lachnellula hyalina]
MDWKLKHERRDEALLPSHEYSNDDSDYEEPADGEVEGRNSFKGTLFVILCTTATLTGRRILRDGFPFFFVLLLQVTASCSVAVVVLFVKLKSFPKPGLINEGSEERKYTVLQKLVIGIRLFVSASISAVAVLCGAGALMLFENLGVFAMLPILTYVSDSLILRFLHIIRVSRREKTDIFWASFWKVILVPFCIAVAVHEDYRLDDAALLLALTSLGLTSIARSISKIGPRYEKGQATWDTPLHVVLLTGIPALAITGYATVQFEDMVAASHIIESWAFWRSLMNIGPGALLYVVFAGTMNSAYPFLSQDHAGGALEDPSIQGKEAVRNTLHTGFWITLVGVCGNEHNLINWYQAIAFTILYVVSVGPRHIGYYPPRFLNLILRIFRRKPQPIHSEPWQFAVILPITTIVFAVLISTNSMYWIDTAAYNRNLKTWLGPDKLSVDTVYSPPQTRSLDIIIAHSPGDPVESITELIAAYTSVRALSSFGPRIIVYTKDADLSNATPESIRGSFRGDVSIQSLHNSGGVSATFMHHILFAWEFISQQTLFLSTSSEYPLLHTTKRLNAYFQPAGFPLPDAQPKTGFLHLGEQEECWCGACSDSTGWDDTFHLVPSMWAAARPGASTCESVLVTRGNEFVASAARVRGVKRDLWQMLYDALTNEDMGHAWSHASDKLPRMLEGEGRMGRWSEDGVYSVPDSVEEPVLGLTVERLWAILLQCSGPEIAWRCPSLGRGLRRGGGRDDCACID